MEKDQNNPWLLTREQKLDYARRLRIFAVKMRTVGDLKSAELNDWMAENYERGDK